MLWAAGLAFHRIWTVGDLRASDAAMMMLVVGAVVTTIAQIHAGTAAMLVAVPCAIIVVGLVLEHHVLPLSSQIRAANERSGSRRTPSQDVLSETDSRSGTPESLGHR